MELETLQILWFAVFIATIFAYSALDGFDIGVGCLHLFTKSDLNRRIFMNAIGPVWDSNSLWVVISAGVLLAGFPLAFSMLLSCLYIPMVLLIFCYTYRTVAIEFRSKIASPRWRTIWDVIFSVASYGLAFGLGLFIANLLQGLPLDQDGECIHNQRHLFTPFSLLIGLFAIVLFMLHGSLYLSFKTQGPLHVRMQRWSMRLFWIFMLMSIIVNSYTPFFEVDGDGLKEPPLIAYPVGALGIAGFFFLYYSLKKQFAGWAFLSSSIIILSLVLLFAIGTYPNLVRSQINPAYSLTIFNASSSAFTLKILLGMTLAGVPLFLLYAGYAYRVFRGKVELDTMSY